LEWVCSTPWWTYQQARWRFIIQVSGKSILYFTLIQDVRIALLDVQHSRHFIQSLNLKIERKAISKAMIYICRQTVMVDKIQEISFEQDLRFSRWWLWRMESSGMLRHVALVRIEVSEELSDSFIRVTRSGPFLVTLMKESLSTTKPSILTRATCHNIPEDAILHKFWGLHNSDHLDCFLLIWHHLVL
jgi:hypothetical protein